MRDDTPSLPVGTVTFLFSDIEGSTRLVRDLGPAYVEALMQHRHLLEECWAAQEGVVVDVAGDGYVVAFASADAGCAAAIAGQRALGAASWPGDMQLRVRMALHTGHVVVREGDYVSLAVHQAARVVSCAHGGQVLLTTATRKALADPDAVPMEDLGRYTVRDFDEPQTLYRVRSDGWEGFSRPPAARPADGHNIQRPIMPLVGRTDDLAWLRGQVRPCALVSLVGPGGVGKTRLALEFGLEVADEWPDGVWFVDLVATRTGGEVAAAVAESIAARPQPGRAPLDDAVAHLAQQSALVILDNCEHVLLEAGEVAARLLRDCPGVGILATSQRSLGLHGQPVRRLVSLAVDGPDPAAVRLFCQRSGDVAPDEIDDVRALCALVDGLPLAIELVAASSATLRPATTLELLRAGGVPLAVEDPTLPERHRSLTTVLELSRQMLDPPAEAVLRRLSLFPGSFSLRDAVVAAAAEDVSRQAVPALLLSLVDRSLVLVDPAAGTSRFRLQAPVRAHARQLCAPPEFERSLESLAEVYLDRVGPHHATGLTWLGEVTDELDNIRGVVRELAGHAAEPAQQLAWSIAEFHAVRSAYATGAGEVVDHLDLLWEPTPARVALLGRAASLLIHVGDPRRALPLLDEADRVASSVGSPPWDEAGHLRARGELLLREGDFASAVGLAREIISSATTPRARAKGWNLRGIALASQGDLEPASTAFMEEVRACEDGGFDLYLAMAQGNVAEACYRLGDWSEAARYQRAVLQGARSYGRTASTVYSLILAARMLPSSDDETAVALEHAATEAAKNAGIDEYDTDEAVRREHLALRSGRMGRDSYRRAVERGRAMDLDEAASAAELILETIDWRGGRP